MKPYVLPLSLLCLLSCWECVAQEAVQQVQQQKEITRKTIGTFEGRWDTTFGEMVLKLDGQKLTGTYSRGTIRGTVSGNSFSFYYNEKTENGSGQFELSNDGTRFTGRYKASNRPQSRKWSGTRAKRRGFQGLWNTSFGKMRLTVSGQQVTGAYNFQGTEAKIQGRVKGERLDFQYVEPDASGKAWFEISKDGESISGKYVEDGQSVESRWEGTRVEESTRQKWLVILEANWERSLEEKEYAFADMLKQYFTMSAARHVNVRKRSFHDSVDLKRFCRELKYLPGSVVLLLSTHGTKDGLTVFDETITPKQLADGLVQTNNLELIHLSGCSMMAGDFPDKVQSFMSDFACPISGYKTDVAWDGSAIADFTYLSMLLIHRMKPAKAVQQAIKLSPYLGDRPIESKVYQPLGLSIKGVD